MSTEAAGLPELTDVQSWLGLAIAVVLLASFGMADVVRYTLIAVILYVLLVNSDRLAPQIARWNRSLAASIASNEAGPGFPVGP